MVVAVLVFFVSPNRAENQLTPLAALAFGFIVAGILFGKVRILGYTFMVVGIIVAVIDVFRHAGELVDKYLSWLVELNQHGLQ